jgi:hypothetical protein
MRRPNKRWEDGRSEWSNRPPLKSTYSAPWLNSGTHTQTLSSIEQQKGFFLNKITLKEWTRGSFHKPKCEGEREEHIFFRGRKFFPHLHNIFFYLPNIFFVYYYNFF